MHLLPEKWIGYLADKAHLTPILKLFLLCDFVQFDFLKNGCPATHQHIKMVGGFALANNFAKSFHFDDLEVFDELSHW
jgi:hypothetical protein